MVNRSFFRVKMSSGIFCSHLTKTIMIFSTEITLYNIAPSSATTIFQQICFPNWMFQTVFRSSLITCKKVCRLPGSIMNLTGIVNNNTVSSSRILWSHLTLHNLWIKLITLSLRVKLIWSRVVSQVETLPKVSLKTFRKGEQITLSIKRKRNSFNHRVR